MTPFPDFIIIGAQKAGTTSMHAWLRDSLGIWMPAQKELQFFSNDSEFAKGLEYYRLLFAESGDNEIVGEASPQYMCSRKAAERIACLCPGTKLIVVLRDPVERAISHYRMTRRRGRTDRTLADCIDELIRRDGNRLAEPDLDHDYLEMGLYGYQLNRFREFAERDQLRVFFLEDLIRDSRASANEIVAFLAADKGLKLGPFPHAHRGGVSRFGQVDRFLRSSNVVRAIARAVLSPSQRKALSFQYETRINVRATESETIDTHLRQRLREYYDQDRMILERFLGRKVPWA